MYLEVCEDATGLCAEEVPPEEGTTTLATTTPVTDTTLNFGIGIIIVMMSMYLSGYIYNHLTDTKGK